MMPRTSALRTHAFVLAVACAVAFTATSCDVFGGLADPADSDAALVRFVEPVNGILDLSLYATASGRDAYVVFTTGDGEPATTPSASQKDTARAPSHSATGRPSGAAEKASAARRAGFRRSMETFLPVPAPRFNSTGDPTLDDEGDSRNFTLWGDQSGSTTAVCRYVSGDVTFNGRTRSLSIWVPETEWSGSDMVDGKVSPAEISALAEAFFGTADNRSDSIYAWVTNMLGEEWGPEGTIPYNGSNLDTIGVTNNITILIADIADDGSAFIDDGGVVGYFYPGDTIPAFAYSNERVMFTIDSVMLGTMDGSSWDVSDSWPATVLSTLAHEFQHMIHFYQKGVKLGGDYFDEPTWIDELCSMQVEDLLADKMGVPGLRGVDPDDGTAGSRGNYSGRLPEYLLWPDVSPLDWDDAADDELTRYYSWAYSFGAYLTRNYGGAEFIRRVVQSSSADASAVVAAASAASGRDESMDSLLRRWGAAVLLSGRTDAPAFYRYNTGGYAVSKVGGLEYRLGSINLYNYVYPDGVDTDGDDAGDEDLTGPWVYSSAFLEDMDGGAYSNAFMDLGDPSRKTGWKITVPAGMFATIVID